MATGKIVKCLGLEIAQARARCIVTQTQGGAGVHCVV